MSPNNKFARQPEQIVKRIVARDEQQSTIDAQLARLEEDIRRLKIEYDIFFNNGAKRAPNESKMRVETALKRIGDDRGLTFAQRYHYNALVARYTSFRELWRRTMQGREEGREAAYIERAKLVRATEDEAPAPPPVPTSFTCANVQSEAATVKKIYAALIAAKAQCGERADELSFDAFEKQLAAQTERFKVTNNCQRVSFNVGVENGRVFFKAKVGV